jgi:dienelactone hydrolase
MSEMATLMRELNSADIPHAAKIYGGARHAFTVPSSDDYVEEADVDSFAGLLEFLGDEL